MEALNPDHVDITKTLTEEELYSATVLIDDKLKTPLKEFPGLHVHPDGLNLVKKPMNAQGNLWGHGSVKERPYFDARGRNLSLNEVEKAFPHVALVRALHCIDCVFTIRHKTVSQGAHQYLVAVQRLLRHRAKMQTRTPSKDRVDVMVSNLEQRVQQSIQTKKLFLVDRQTKKLHGSLV